MTCELDLHRDLIEPTRCLGRLSIDSVWICDTVEDADLRLEEGKNAKIPGKTAIPRGRYRLVIDRSNRFSRIASKSAGEPVDVFMPHLLAVPGFDGIRIHWGNTELDVEGCIAVGIRAPNGVYNSRVTYRKLMPILTKKADDGEEIWITIR